MQLVSLYNLVDELCKGFEPKWQAHFLSSGVVQRAKTSSLSLSEALTIVIHFHQSNHKTFKQYDTD